MKKILLLTAVTILSLSFLGVYFNARFLLILLLLLLVLAIFLAVFLPKKYKNIALGVFVVALFCLRMLSLVQDINDNSRLYDKTIPLSMTVTEKPIRISDSHYCVEAKITQKNDYLKNGTIVYLYYEAAPEILVGDAISAHCTVNPPFDEAEVRKNSADGVYVNATNKGVIKVESGKSKAYGISFAVQNFVNNTLTKNTENAQLLSAMLSGDKSVLTAKQSESFRIAGISHILVVSGMHLVVLYGAFSAFVGVFGFSKRVKNVFSIFFTFCMMCVCGFSMSVLRAGISFLTAVLYHALRRIPTGLSTLYIALIIVLFISPFGYYSVAFLLTFASTFGILAFYPRLNLKIENNRRLNSFTAGVLKQTALSICAYSLVLPITVYIFKTASLYAIPVNVLVATAASFMLIFTAIAVILSAVPVVGVISKPLFYLADRLCDYINGIVNLANDLPYAELKIKNEKLFCALIIIAIIIYSEYSTCFIRRRLVKYLHKETKG